MAGNGSCQTQTGRAHARTRTPAAIIAPPTQCTTRRSVLGARLVAGASVTFAIVERVSARTTRGGNAAARQSTNAAAELLLDACRVETARCEQDVAVEPEVGKLLDEPLVGFAHTGEGSLDALLADLPCGSC